MATIIYGGSSMSQMNFVGIKCLRIPAGSCEEGSVVEPGSSGFRLY